MALDTAENRPGLRHDRIRRMGYLEAGVRYNPKRVPGAHRVRVHVPCSKVRSTYDLVHAWAIIAVASGTGGVVVGILTTKGHW